MKQEITEKELRIRLKRLYDTINRLFPYEENKELYTTEEELKKNPKNIFI